MSRDDPTWAERGGYDAWCARGAGGSLSPEATDNARAAFCGELPAADDGSGSGMWWDVRLMNGEDTFIGTVAASSAAAALAIVPASWRGYCAAGVRVTRRGVAS